MPQISISVEQMERVEKLLYGVPNEIPKAYSNAFNRALESMRTEAKRQIQQRYAISQGNLSSYETVKLVKSSGGGDASIVFSGSKIPLFKFRPSPGSRSYVGEKIPVLVSNVGWRTVFKNSPVSAMDTLASGMVARPGAFIANFKSGHTGIFKRTGEKTENGNGQIKEYWGYSVADMLDYEPARDAVEQKGQETVEKRLEHEISRILSRY